LQEQAGFGDYAQSEIRCIGRAVRVLGPPATHFALWRQLGWLSTNHGSEYLMFIQTFPTLEIVVKSPAYVYLLQARPRAGKIKNSQSIYLSLRQVPGSGRKESTFGVESPVETRSRRAGGNNQVSSTQRVCCQNAGALSLEIKVSDFERLGFGWSSRQGVDGRAKASDLI
jgi:hypothetical protein